jgi:hypothetical protein
MCSIKRGGCFLVILAPEEVSSLKASLDEEMLIGCAIERERVSTVPKNYCK